ncbi:hypothetical protein EDB67_101317 [Vibrio crassostreae]|nr:hypothetical protein EDB67_101317 [Vibrio crassostreae]
MHVFILTEKLEKGIHLKLDYFSLEDIQSL